MGESSLTASTHLWISLWTGHLTRLPLLCRLITSEHWAPTSPLLLPLQSPQDPGYLPLNGCPNHLITFLSAVTFSAFPTGSEPDSSRTPLHTPHSGMQRCLMTQSDGLTAYPTCPTLSPCPFQTSVPAEAPGHPTGQEERGTTTYLLPPG